MWHTRISKPWLYWMRPRVQPRLHSNPTSRRAQARSLESGGRASPFPLRPLPACMRFAMQGMPSRTSSARCFRAGDFFRVQPKKIRILPRNARRCVPSSFGRGRIRTHGPRWGLLFSRQVQSAALPLFQNKALMLNRVDVYLKEIVRENGGRSP